METPKVFETYADAIYSGKYIHPDTARNMPTTPPLDDKPIEKAQPTISHSERSWPRVLIILITVAGLLLFGFFSWKVIRMPSQTIEPKISDTIIETRGYLTDQLDYIVDQVTARILPLIPSEKVIIKDYGPRQDAAIEKIKAWERIHLKLIDEHYHSKELPGKRTLCIAMGANKDCQSIYVRPKANAGLDLQQN